MRISSLIPLALASHSHLTTAAYTLKTDYGNTMTFFDKFTFFTAQDPTHGYVDYIDRPAAEADGLISANDNSVYMGVDAKNPPSQRGRRSVRIPSKESYVRGLIVLDLAHAPGGVCGTWPAFGDQSWTVGTNWPNNGEIDIIEGVNDQAKNHMVLHTKGGDPGCSIANTGFSGKLLTSNCAVDGPGQPMNAGCGIEAASPDSYGDGLNRAGGGVYATEWTDEAITIWHFPRDKVPRDVTGERPDPRGWGMPVARFAGDCDINGHFGAQQIVFDITFCGDWAGNTWGSGSCASKANSCQDFVTNNAGAFQESFWRINSLKVYQNE